MDRTQFTFYESFFKATALMESKDDRADFYDAVCAYALYGREPDVSKMSNTCALAFELSRPNLAASRRKASSGKRGGSKSGASKPEAKRKRNTSKESASESGASEIENERENKKEIEKENDSYPPTPLVGVVGSVLADYMDRINPAASQNSLDELKGYAEELGEAVCKRAFDIALDSKKPTWPYIRGILRRLQSQGVRCLADWEALERRRDESPAGYDYSSKEGSL